MLTVTAFTAPGVAFSALPDGAFFPGDTLDGPTVDIDSLGDLEIAHDGTGVLVYLKKDGAANHVFASRLFEGRWLAPERVDVGLEGESTSPVVAVSDEGRALIAFVNGGALYGIARPEDATAWQPPTVLYSDPDPALKVSTPSADIGVNSHGYVVFTVGSGSSANVRAVRLDGTSWSQVATPLDVDPGREAGTGDGRPRVTVSADGNAVAIWGEDTSDGSMHVKARRLTGIVPGSLPQDLNLAELEGRSGGGASHPEIDIEDDSSYAWAVFEQRFNDSGTTRKRVIARRLVGSLFEAPVAVDTLTFPASEGGELPRLSMDGRGVGIATGSLTSSFATVAARLKNDQFSPASRIDSLGGASQPHAVPAVGENETGVVAWQYDPGGGGNPSLRGRHLTKSGVFEPEVELARPEYGPVAAKLGLFAAADRTGNVAIAFVQGKEKEGERRISIATYDRRPSAPSGLTTTKFQRRGKPMLRWRAAQDLWGPVTYTVEIDGVVAGQTVDTEFLAKKKLKEGLHRWRVIGADRNGQQVSSATRNLRVDTIKPTGQLKVSGVRKRGRSLLFRVRAKDPRSSVNLKSSGIRRVSIDFGDRTPKLFKAVARHTYRSRGKYKVKVAITDNAGNVTKLERKIQIGK